MHESTVRLLFLINFKNHPIKFNKKIIKTKKNKALEIQIKTKIFVFEEILGFVFFYIQVSIKRLNSSYQNNNAPFVPEGIYIKYNFKYQIQLIIP